MNKSSRMLPFVFGLAVGIAGTIFLPNYVRPYLPEWVMGKAIVVKGTVTAKQKKEKVLLLTVNTPEGALLATFNKKVDEISLLVSEKDIIEFTLPKYTPFIDDPKIIRIVKEQQAVTEPAPVVMPAEKNTQERRSQRQVKPQAVVPVTEGTTTVKPPERK